MSRNLSRTEVALVVIWELRGQGNFTSSQAHPHIQARRATRERDASHNHKAMPKPTRSTTPIMIMARGAGVQLPLWVHTVRLSRVACCLFGIDEPPPHPGLVVTPRGLLPEEPVTPGGPSQRTSPSTGSASSTIDNSLYTSQATFPHLQLAIRS